MLLLHLTRLYWIWARERIRITAHSIIWRCWTTVVALKSVTIIVFVCAVAVCIKAVVTTGADSTVTIARSLLILDKKQEKELYLIKL